MFALTKDKDGEHLGTLMLNFSASDLNSIGLFFKHFLSPNKVSWFNFVFLLFDFKQKDKLKECQRLNTSNFFSIVILHAAKRRSS